MFEQKHQKLAPLPVFVWRLVASVLLSTVLILFSLGIGVAGYHWVAGLGWVDAILNAAMILGGMGPVDRLQSDDAKIFAAAYALFSGLIFIALMGILLSPVVHRLLHKFHIDEGDIS